MLHVQARVRLAPNIGMPFRRVIVLVELLLLLEESRTRAVAVAVVERLPLIFVLQAHHLAIHCLGLVVVVAEQVVCVGFLCTL